MNKKRIYLSSPTMHQEEQRFIQEAFDNNWIAPLGKNVDEFEKEIKSLAKMPKRIKTVNEQPWKDAGIRKTRVKNYYIYFLVDDDEMAVKVNAVIYTGRDQTKQMTDRRMEEL